MENLFPLLLAALIVYLLFFRKGGMGMGCCGGHGSHDSHDNHGRQSSHGGYGGHGHELDQNRHFNGLSEDGKEDIIDLRKDQYTVLTVEEDKHSKELDKTV